MFVEFIILYIFEDWTSLERTEFPFAKEFPIKSIGIEVPSVYSHHNPVDDVTQPSFYLQVNVNEMDYGKMLKPSTFMHMCHVVVIYKLCVCMLTTNS